MHLGGSLELVLVDALPRSLLEVPVVANAARVRQQEDVLLLVFLFNIGYRVRKLLGLLLRFCFKPLWSNVTFKTTTMSDNMKRQPGWLQMTNSDCISFI